MDNPREIPVVVLESSSPTRLGDLSIFRTFADAEQGLEPIDVRNGDFFAFTLDGFRLELKTDGHKVSIRCASDSAEHAANVRDLLERYVQSISDKKKLGLEPNSLPLSELVRIVGYD